MNLAEFGLLVKTLRQSNHDEYGKRWTRESLSEKIHLTPHQLGRLERGDRKYLDNITLQFLAESLNLTALEQKELLLAAIGLPDKEIYGLAEREVSFSEITDPLEKVLMPAFIMDVYADMIAANSALLKLWMLTPELLAYAETIPAGFNVVNFMYSSQSGFKAMIGPRWREYALIEIYLFRRSSLRFRHTAYFQHVFQTLLKEKEFDIDWYSSHRNTTHYNFTYVDYSYVHPFYGPLSYLITETGISTIKDNLYLIVYNPLDDKTASVFKELIEPDNFHVRKMADWPEKIIRT